MKVWWAASMIMFFFLIPLAQAGLSITAPSSVSFSSAIISSTSNQNRNASFDVTVSDDRTGSPGWTTTMSSSHLSKIAGAKKIAGNNNTVSSAGSYDGTFGVATPWKKYVLTITVGGTVGTAKFDVSDAEIQTNLTTGSLISIGTKGVRADFDVATYAVNDQWEIAVDSFPYTDITVTPGTITANSGSLTGVSAGTSGNLSGTGDTSSPLTLMSASTGNGTGNYTQSISIDVLLHKNSLPGNFTGVFTFTIQ